MLLFCIVLGRVMTACDKWVQHLDSNNDIIVMAGRWWTQDIIQTDHGNKEYVDGMLPLLHFSPSVLVLSLIKILMIVFLTRA